MTNDGPESPTCPASLDPTFPIREGIGISNTRKRLEALYGDHQTIAVTQRPGGGVQAIIEIPLHWPAAMPPEMLHSVNAARA